MSEELIEINHALFSVTDKSELRTFADGLREVNPNLEFIASGGTAKTLETEGVRYTPLDQYTEFPECFGGRVKTLHPKIAGGILQKEEDASEAEKLGVGKIDLVVCNLYNFSEAAKDPSLPMNQLVEFMDIGGSTLIRAASKNYKRVVVIVDPADYTLVLSEMREKDGAISLRTREKLAVKAMNLSADYEALLAKHFAKRLDHQETQRTSWVNGRKLRYGENPDQQAWVYEFGGEKGVAQSAVLTGKEPSFNNYEDATAAWSAVQELDTLGAAYGVAIVKHGGLCGYATGATLTDAFQGAWNGDPKSAFGGVIAFTKSVDESLIPEVKSKFIEVILAPDFSEGFIEWVREAKPNLRCLKVPTNISGTFHYKNVSGGILLQTVKPNIGVDSLDSLFREIGHDKSVACGVVTQRKPNVNKFSLIAFAIAAVKFGKSNATAIVRETKPGYYSLLGMGAGQPNRVDSLERLAIPKALENLESESESKNLSECVLASDGFFPFDDSIRVASKHGIRYCVQPGGSKRDKEVIKAADEEGMCMIFTGERYFYH